MAVIYQCRRVSDGKLLRGSLSDSATIMIYNTMGLTPSYYAIDVWSSKIYNSAILYYQGKMIVAVATTSRQTLSCEMYESGQWSQYGTYTLSLYSSAPGASYRYQDDSFPRYNCGDVQVYGMEFVGNDDVDTVTSPAGLPIFTNPSDFLNHISKYYYDQWRNVNINVFNIPQATVNDFSFVYDTYKGNNIATKATINNDIAPESVNYVLNSYAFGSANGYGLYCSNNNNTTYKFTSYYNGSSSSAGGYLQYIPKASTTTTTGIFFIACVDENRKVGHICVMGRNYSSSTGTYSYVTYNTTPNQCNEILYHLLVDNETSPYTWTPVSRINGKMGNISLSQIIYLNDGDPVSGADSEDVNFTDASNLEILIQNAVYNNDAVTVTYDIPSGDYEYIKLVYKYGNVPEDIDDGTAIDITQDSTECVITDIENPDNYWFIIFTDKTASVGYELIIDSDTAIYNLLAGMF